MYAAEIGCDMMNNLEDMTHRSCDKNYRLNTCTFSKAWFGETFS